VPQQRGGKSSALQNDTACRVFLSTDTGGLGLNRSGERRDQLRPAVESARTGAAGGRAWRKHQMRSVTVVNLVTEDSSKRA
jgi:hypothetical protein